jgi:hypothetical protein
MTLKRIFAIFFVCPVLGAVIGFLLGLALPTPAARFQFHQAQGFLFSGLAWGFLFACGWVGINFFTKYF